MVTIVNIVIILAITAVVTLFRYTNPCKILMHPPCCLSAIPWSFRPRRGVHNNKKGDKNLKTLNHHLYKQNRNIVMLWDKNHVILWYFWYITPWKLSGRDDFLNIPCLSFELYAFTNAVSKEDTDKLLK